MFAKRIALTATAGALLLSLSGLAVAQRPLARLNRLRTYLALNDQQVAEIQSLLRKHQQAAFPLRQDLRATNHQLKNALGIVEPNPATVGQLVIARRQITSRVRALRIKLGEEIAAKLTPEQKEKFKALKSKFGRRARNA